MKDADDWLRVEFDRIGDHLKVAIAGELDLASAPRLRDVASGIGPDVHVLTLDLSGLHFADVSGLRALNTVIATASDHGTKARIVGMSTFLTRVMHLAGFSLLAQACEEAQLDLFRREEEHCADR